MHIGRNFVLMWPKIIHYEENFIEFEKNTWAGGGGQFETKNQFHKKVSNDHQFAFN